METATKAQPKKPKFTNQNPGVKVAAGKNWITGLTHEERRQALLQHEYKWKKKYNEQRATMNLTRG